RPLASVIGLPDAERFQLLYEWNDSAISFPSGGISERFEASVRSAPDRIAVTCGSESVSYAALQQRSHALASRICQWMRGPEPRVAVLASRSSDFLTTMLAIFDTCAVYVPLEPASPRPRTLRLLRESGAEILLVDEQEVSDWREALAAED